MTKIPLPGPNETVLHEIVRYSPSLRDSTKRTYLVDVDAWVAFAGTDQANWTRYTAQKFYQSLLERMTVRSANRVMATMSYAAGWWAKKEGNPQLDFSIVQKAAASSTPTLEGDEGSEAGNSLSTDEQQRLLAEIVKDRKQDPQRVTRDLAIAVVALETGMRRMSLVSMKLQTTTVDRGPLITDVALKRMPDLYPVALSDTAALALEPWLLFLRSAKITKGPVWRSLRLHGGKITIGAGFTDQAIYDMVRKYGHQAKVDLTPHTFRHTFISQRLAAGWTPQQVASITGHQLPRALGAPGIGAMHRYVDPSVFWPTVSTGTAQWLTDFVKRNI